jgi:2-dehydropantoate 2-reductase
MKIAVVGCGAVGSYYGARLAQSGQDVHFLLRSDFDAVRRNGVLVRSPKGDFRVRPKCARSPEEIGPSDLVVIGLKTTANAQFRRLLPSLVGPQTAVLTLQNGLGNEEHLAQLFPPEQIMGGLCFVCLNRIEPGIIHHLDHGLVVLGEFQGWPEPRTHDIAGLFRNAGIPCNVSDNLARAHWEKLVWNIPFNGLGVAGAAGYETLTGVRPSSGAATLNADRTAQSVRDDNAFTATAPEDGRTPPKLGACLSTDKLLADPKWETVVRELMAEVVATARAAGFPIEDGLAERQIERTRTMAAYRASTLIDFERGLPLELDSLFFEPLRRAQKAGVPTPRLSALCTVLKVLDERRSA